MDIPDKTLKIDLKDIEIKPFDSKVRRAAFSCSRENMNSFLKKSAEDKHKRYHTRVYYALFNDKLVGYYSISAASRRPGEISQDAVKHFSRIDSAPCLYLGMLAVDSTYERNGIGQMLMVHAMSTTAAVAEKVGIYALILEAADAAVAARYARWGFEYFAVESDSLRMVMPLSTIRAAQDRAGAPLPKSM